MLHRKRVVMVVTFVFMFMVMCAPGVFGQTVVTDAPTNQTTTNICNGDVVTLNGTLHQEMSFSTNSNGMIHMVLNATSHLTGVGTSGLTYVENDSTHLETNARACAQENSNNWKLKLISQGPAPNMMDHATLHVVVDSSCVPKVEISKHQMQCN